MQNSSPVPANLARGYTIALISAVFLSTTAIFIRHLTLTYQMPALVLAFWRDVFVVLTLLLALGFARPRLLRLPPRHLPYLVAYGLVLAIFNAMWTLSVSLNGAAVATVLVYCSAGFTALLGWWLLKERLGWAKLLAVAFSLSGCVLVSGALDTAAWQANLLGIGTGIFSGPVLRGLQPAGPLRCPARAEPLDHPGLYLCLCGCYFCWLLISCRVVGCPAPPPGRAICSGWAAPWTGWGVLFLLAAVPTVAGFGLYNVSLSYLPSSVANLIVTMEPAFTAVEAYIFFDERLTAIQLGGALMIVSGVILLRVYEGWLASQARPARDPATDC